MGEGHGISAASSVTTLPPSPLSTIGARAGVKALTSAGGMVEERIAEERVEEKRNRRDELFNLFVVPETRPIPVPISISTSGLQSKDAAVTVPNPQTAPLPLTESDITDHRSLVYDDILEDERRPSTRGGSLKRVSTAPASTDAATAKEAPPPVPPLPTNLEALSLSVKGQKERKEKPQGQSALRRAWRALTGRREKHEERTHAQFYAHGHGRAGNEVRVR